MSTKEKNKTKITIDTSKAGSNIDVVRLCINELGWQEYPNGSKNLCDIYWHSQAYQEGYANNIFRGNRTGCVNKFPCMNQLLHKGALIQSLNVMRSIFNNEYDFYPRTWFLPEQFEDFRLHCTFVNEKQTRVSHSIKVFIVKPDKGSQGDGIYLIKDADGLLDLKSNGKLLNNEKYIVQEYIDNPFLMDNLKFDLRIYVIVSNLRPLEVYMYDEGLVRFATINYETPDYQNLDQIFMHLTNYAINKQNEKYKFTAENSKDDNSCGSKRKLTKVFAQLKYAGHDIDKLKKDIDDLVIKTMFALMPEMKVDYAFEIPYRNRKDGTACFQILGFDILLTDKLKPMLLEVNCNPSLRIDFLHENQLGKTISIPSPIDRDIKKPLIYETLLMMAPKKKLEQIAYEEIQAQQSTLKNENFLKNIDKRKPQDKDNVRFNIGLTKDTIGIRQEYEVISEPKSKEKLLRIIYPCISTNNEHSYLNLIENIADIFIYLTYHDCRKLLYQNSYRYFIEHCYLVNDNVSIENLDICFIQSLKKWANYSKRKDTKGGLCFQGFVELFITFSRLYFVEDTLEQSISSMIYYCIKLLKIVGYRDNDFCVVSKNGPIRIANKRVKLKIKEILKNLMHENMEQNEYEDLKSETNKKLIDKLKGKINKKPLVGKITVKIKNCHTCLAILNESIQELCAFQNSSLSDSDIYLIECENLIQSSRILIDILEIYYLIENQKLDFLPQTWSMSQENKNFSTKSGMFIIKSNEKNYLIEDLNVLNEMEVAFGRDLIIQEYIENPLLINGLKADLKLFTVVSHSTPNEIYINKEGIVKWYLTSKIKFKNAKFIELDEIIRNFDDDNSLSSFYQKLEKLSRGKIDKLKSDINTKIVQLAKLILFKMKGEHVYDNQRTGVNLYQLISFNFIITSSFKPICIGIDMSTSFEQQNESDNLSTLVFSEKQLNHLSSLKSLIKELLILTAPKRKLELIKKHKMEEEHFKMKSKSREIVAKQRIEQRLKEVQKSKKIDLDKCPLLTKPASQYKNKTKQNEKKILQNDFNSNSSYFFTQVYSELEQENSSIAAKILSPDVVNNNFELKNLIKVDFNVSNTTFKILECLLDVFLSLTTQNGLKIINLKAFKQFLEIYSLENDNFSFKYLCEFFNESVKKYSMNEGLTFNGFVYYITSLAKSYFPMNLVENSIIMFLDHIGVKEKDFFINTNTQKVNNKINLKRNKLKKNASESSLASIFSKTTQLTTNSVFIEEIQSITTTATKLNSKSRRSLFPIYF